jgi:Epoxide hydrolase N terminus
MSEAAIRPFHVDFAEAELTELRRRIGATRWPDRETVADQSQGPQLATLQKLARYWMTEYDWRKVEARLNALPNFITEIDGLISTSFTCVRDMRTPCRSSSRTAGPARSSSS